jgi:ABC-type transport system involved in cytochrome c biogenesis permease subunit
MSRPFARSLWIVVALLLAACSRPAPRVARELERTSPWSPEVVERFGSVPLQHEGRVMPASTLASFTLYAVHGRRDVQFVTNDRGVDTKHKLSPTEWLLDMVCFREQAAHYPMFRIENVGVLAELGIPHEGQKQGFEYLSYAQLMSPTVQGDETRPVDRLQDKAQKLRPKKEQQRSEVENHVVHLFDQLWLFHRLYIELDVLRHEFALEGDALRALFGGASTAGLGAVLARVDALRALQARARAEGNDSGDGAATVAGNAAQVERALQGMAASGATFSLFPPLRPAAEADTWHTLPEVVEDCIDGSVPEPHVAMVASLQQAIAATSTPERERHLLAYVDAVDAAAARRGDARTVATESYYYRANWHFHAMMTFVLGFLLAVAACVMPRSRLPWWASFATSVAALGMLTADIWLRCVITGHPPIGRLYDTFLFIGGVAALVLLITEWVLPRRLCLVLAPLLGAMLIMLARLFEVADGQDTMKPLQAVLLSNFWLGVHVPTINVGYAVSLAAAGIAVAWIALRALRVAHPSESLPKSLIRAVYGVSCFGLATSVVGTITGGVWANDSWGRFWGWDPKENGALLICLSQIAMLHARMTGMVRDAGTALWSVATGMIVIFSWFHTNLLGVGLHAYGFSDDLRDGVWISYAVLGGVLGIGAADVLLRPNPAPIVRAGAALPAPAPQ